MKKARVGWTRIPVRLRLSLGHSLFMLLLFVLLGFGLYKVIESNLNSSVDAALLSAARSARDVRVEALKYNKLANHPFLHEIFDNPLLLERLTGQKVIRPYAQMIDVSGRVYSKTDNANVVLPLTKVSLVRAELGQSTIENFQVGGAAPMRQVTLPVVVRGRFTGELIQVGTSLSHLRETLRGILLLLYIVLPLAFLVSVLLGYFLTARALLPVRNISRAAARLGIDDLSIRLPVSVADDELRELARIFNGMLDRLEVAVTKLRRFSGDVSHELRTPLAVLRGEAELALRKQRQPEQYVKSLHTILCESTQMTTIVEDLLLFARAESGSLVMRMEHIRLEPLLEEVRSGVASVFKKHGVSLRIEHLTTSGFHGSKTYLVLAIKNLLINAAKHSQPRSEVLLKVFAVKDDMIFRVQDWGEGIPDAAIPHIFSPFFRVDTARPRSKGGVGLGLSLAAALVKLHSGAINVASELGRGSQFSLSIPIKSGAVK